MIQKYKLIFSFILAIHSLTASAQISCHFKYAHFKYDISVLQTTNALTFQETNIYNRFIVYSQYLSNNQKLKILIYQEVDNYNSPIYFGEFKIDNLKSFNTGNTTLYGKEYEREVSFSCSG